MPGEELYESDIVKKIYFESETNVDSKKIFDVMSDIEKYPMIIPNNINKIRLINQTDIGDFGTTSWVEADVTEAGVRMQVTFQHIVDPPNKIILKDFSGDFQGTKIIQIIKNNNTKTILETELVLRFTGLLTPLGLIPDRNLEHAMGTIIDKFVEYVKENNQ